MGLKFPPASPLNELITTDKFWPSIDLAKKATALEGCIKLYKIGELTDDLVPKTEKDVLIKLDHLFPHWCKDEIKDEVTPGTTNFKRHHKIKVL